MKTLEKRAAVLFCVSIALLLVPANVYAWQPGGDSLAQAINTGDFAGYLTGADAWLNQKAPAGAGITEAALAGLLKAPAFLSTLDQRHLIAKTGANELGAFAKATPANKVFLTWLLNNTKAMELYLEGAVPIGLNAREQNNYKLSTETLARWQNIFNADPDSKDGLCLKLAIATAIAPPGSGSPGAGQAKTQATPLDRYMHFKNAQKNKELFPSFDNLTVWELGKVVQSGASDADLAWAREMINSWRPDLRNNELVVNSTSEVWRRNSPIQFDNSYKNVLAGGGKCGPRSSWSVMICQAFGIPAIGVGQPAHACVAYKTAFPMAQPQPGSAWKVGYGRGWQVSKLEGMSGLDFVAAVEDRAHAEQFTQVEHLRWLASALASKDQASATMDLAHKIQKSIPAGNTDVTASAKAAEAEKEIAPEVKAAKAADPKGPFAVSPSGTTIDAALFSRMSGINVYDCYTGGKQVNFQKSVQDSWVEYPLDVPAAGTYVIVIKVAAANVEQVLNVSSGSGAAVTVKVPWTTGLWGATEPTEIKLEAGKQTLKIAAPFQRGVAVKSFELKCK